MRYRISNIKRKYSPTPVVKVETVNGKEKETILCCSHLPKKEGDEFSLELVNFLNKES